MYYVGYWDERWAENRGLMATTNHGTQRQVKRVVLAEKYEVITLLRSTEVVFRINGMAQRWN